MKPVEPSLLAQILRRIKHAEGLHITKNAEKFILNICNNSIRLLINYMEKFKLLDMKITLQRAKEVCTNISFYDLETYTTAWAVEGDMVAAVKAMFTISNKGYSVMDILDSYFQFIKMTDMLDEADKYEATILICRYISYFHTLHEDDIELALFTGELMKRTRHDAAISL